MRQVDIGVACNFIEGLDEARGETGRGGKRAGKNMMNGVERTLSEHGPLSKTCLFEFCAN